MDVHVNEESLATILSLKDVAALPGVRVTMDTEVENAMIVNNVQCSDGLYYFDTANAEKHIITDNDNKDNTFAYSFLTTVNENKQFFHVRKSKEQIKPENCSN